MDMQISYLFLANGGIIIETGFSSALVLPRREPTRVLVGEDKPEYIPKNGIIVADCEVLKRQMLRLRNDLQVKLPSDFEDPPEDVFERVEWLENLRDNGDIDGFITTRILHSTLKSKPRRHTLGMQRKGRCKVTVYSNSTRRIYDLIDKKGFSSITFFQSN